MAWNDDSEVDLTLAGLLAKLGYPVSGQDGFSPTLQAVTGDGGANDAHYGQVGGSPYYAVDPTLGQKYYLPITVTYPDPTNGTITLPDGQQTGGILKTWNLPFPILSVTSKKVIIETPLTERRGTVKELINIEDYVITVRGYIININNEFPEADVTTLRGLYEQNVAISIKNPITDIFLLRPDRSGSDQVVIKELRFPEKRGVKHVREYELVMVSDEPFNLNDIS